MITWKRNTFHDGEITWVYYTLVTDKKRFEIWLYGNTRVGNCALKYEEKVKEATLRRPAQWERVIDTKEFENFKEAKAFVKMLLDE